MPGEVDLQTSSPLVAINPIYSSHIILIIVTSAINQHIYGKVQLLVVVVVCERGWGGCYCTYVTFRLRTRKGVMDMRDVRNLYIYQWQSSRCFPSCRHDKTWWNIFMQKDFIQIFDDVYTPLTGHYRCTKFQERVLSHLCHTQSLFNEENMFKPMYKIHYFHIKEIVNAIIFPFQQDCCCWTTTYNLTGLQKIHINLLV